MVIGLIDRTEDNMLMAMEHTYCNDAYIQITRSADLKHPIGLQCIAMQMQTLVAYYWSYYILCFELLDKAILQPHWDALQVAAGLVGCFYSEVVDTF